MEVGRRASRSNAARWPKMASPFGLRRFLGLCRVAPRLQTHEGYAPSSRLAQPQKSTQRGMLLYFNRLLKRDCEMILGADGLCEGGKEGDYAVDVFQVGHFHDGVHVAERQGD